MAAANPVWGEERIANELLIKRGIRVSSRTVGKYMPERPPGQPRGDQRWATFLRSHARAVLACDFLVAVTATFRLLYVFVVIEHGRRRLAHVGVTNHPTADWTLQQLREVVGDEGAHRYLIHDRDSIFARYLDNSIRAHLRATLREWVRHYNTGRPHKSLGPSVPDPPKVASVIPNSECRHRLAGVVVITKSVLGGLHHEYSLAPGVA